MKQKSMGMIFCIICCVVCLNTTYAQESKTITLPEPQVGKGMPLMQALANRKSTRDFSSKRLSYHNISNLLWAAYGINRQDSGKRTAPSAGNRQEIDIYVSTAQGAFIYDATNNKLEIVTSEDIRSSCGRQDFVKDAPVVLVYIADYSRMRGDKAQKDFYAATDTGFISQNVYLFCASEGLATVVLGMVDRDALSEKLKLQDEQHIILTQPVGYTPSTDN